MPVPTLISELSQTPASNSPVGTVDVPSSIDDYQRTHAAFIATLRDGKGFTSSSALASGATTDIGAQNALFVDISGTTTITSFGTTFNGPRFLRFASALTLTHNATTLVLPGGVNLTTAAGDTLLVIPKTTAAVVDGWVVIAYQRNSSTILAASELQNQTFVAFTTGGTATAYTLTPTPAITAYTAGQSFFVNFNAASGAAPTLTISGVATPPNLVKQIGDGTYANIAANDIPINHRSRVTLLSATQALVEDMPSLTLDIGQFSRCVGQSSKPNAATPLTKYDLFADVVVFYNSVGGTTVRRVAPGTITNDLGLAGVTANGRDQAGAFTADSFVYLYWIWNGSAVATISSLAAPPTGPALPTGYTHWCFATVVRWNASSNIVPSWTKGRQVWYDIADGGVTRIISGGAATSMTAAGAGNFIPALATYVKFTAIFSLTNASIASFSLLVRPTGALNAGQTVLAITIPVAGGSGTVAAQFELPNSANTQIDYKLSAAPTSGGAFVDIVGYTIPNGDV